MNINSTCLCNPRNYSKGRIGPITYIVIHYVGALGGAKANCVYYGRSEVSASAHYYVDHAPLSEVWQSVKDTDTAWHCGRADGKYVHSECRNANSIGIEMCCHQDKAGKWYFDPETVARTVELTRLLMKKYGISANHVVRHYDVTGKTCPAPFVSDAAAWNAFLQRVSAP